MKLLSHAILATFMKRRGYSVRTLAFKIGCDKSTIGHLRSGKRNTCKPEIADAIAKALDCPLELLFSDRVLQDARTLHRRRVA